MNYLCQSSVRMFKKDMNVAAITIFDYLGPWYALYCDNNIWKCLRPMEFSVIFIHCMKQV